MEIKKPQTKEELKAIHKRCMAGEKYSSIGLEYGVTGASVKKRMKSCQFDLPVFIRKGLTKSCSACGKKFHIEYNQQFNHLRVGGKIHLSKKKDFFCCNACHVARQRKNKSK